MYYSKIVGSRGDYLTPIPFSVPNSANPSPTPLYHQRNVNQSILNLLNHDEQLRKYAEQMERNRLNKEKRWFDRRTGRYITETELTNQHKLINQRKMLALNKTNYISPRVQTQPYPKLSTLSSPKVYTLADIRKGAFVMNDGTSNQVSNYKNENIIQIIFDALQLHSFPNGREWKAMCRLITAELTKIYGGVWHCMAGTQKFYSIVHPASNSGDYMNVKLDDLFIELFRSQ